MKPVEETSLDALELADLKVRMAGMEPEGLD